MVIDLLCAHGADMNASMEGGHTPLDAAFARNDEAGPSL
jgi:ankyrin repeat protein